ncbi:PTS sugar transporter subunit IIB [Bacillus songklensis]|uniref:PTS sugar transporter subunit IIB n=1 Tax=Bacillus songklensis TaxID=1069116 RepID=A0ABV8B906_9BACI
MLKIVTVCGNGIGSSLMLKMKIEEICEEEGITVDVESCDFAAAQGKEADFIITVKEFATHFVNKDVLIVRSYMNKNKIREDVLPGLRKKS